MVVFRVEDPFPVGVTPAATADPDRMCLFAHDPIVVEPVPAVNERRTLPTDTWIYLSSLVYSTSFF
jgi:hypothetical protein